MTGDRVDIGHGHEISEFTWQPDRDLNPQWEDVPDVDVCGVQVWHWRPSADGTATQERCVGAVWFDTPEVREMLAAIGQTDRWVWTVERADPLTLSPSIACRSCGDHGYIRDGCWVPA